MKSYQFMDGMPQSNGQEQIAMNRATDAVYGLSTVDQAVQGTNAATLVAAFRSSGISISKLSDSLASYYLTECQALRNAKGAALSTLQYTLCISNGNVAASVTEAVASGDSVTIMTALKAGSAITNVVDDPNSPFCCRAYYKNSLVAVFTTQTKFTLQQIQSLGVNNGNATAAVAASINVSSDDTLVKLKNSSLGLIDVMDNMKVLYQTNLLAVVTTPTSVLTPSVIQNIITTTNPKGTFVNSVDVAVTSNVSSQVYTALQALFPGNASVISSNQVCYLNTIMLNRTTKGAILNETQILAAVNECNSIALLTSYMIGGTAYDANTFKSFVNVATNRFVRVDISTVLPSPVPKMQQYYTAFLSLTSKTQPNYQAAMDTVNGGISVGNMNVAIEQNNPDLLFSVIN